MLRILFAVFFTQVTFISALRFQQLLSSTFGFRSKFYPGDRPTAPVCVGHHTFVLATLLPRGYSDILARQRHIAVAVKLEKLIFVRLPDLIHWPNKSISYYFMVRAVFECQRCERLAVPWVGRSTSNVMRCCFNTWSHLTFLTRLFWISVPLLSKSFGTELGFLHKKTSPWSLKYVIK